MQNYVIKSNNILFIDYFFLFIAWLGGFNEKCYIFVGGYTISGVNFNLKTMKLSRLFILAVAVVAVACSSTPTQRVENIVNKAETEGANYTEEQWAQLDLEYEKVCDEIEANYDQMTPEEQRAAMKAMGRYYGLRTKQGLNEAFEEAKEACDKLPSLIEGFTDAFKE